MDLILAVVMVGLVGILLCWPIKSSVCQICGRKLLEGVCPRPGGEAGRRWDEVHR